MQSVHRVQMCFHELERRPNDLARALVVVRHVEAMLPGGVIHEGDWRVSRDCAADERIESLVQGGDCVATGASEEQRRERWSLDVHLECELRFISDPKALYVHQRIDRQLAADIATLVLQRHREKRTTR